MWIQTEVGSMLNSEFLKELYIEETDNSFDITAIDIEDELHLVSSHKSMLEAKEKLRYGIDK